jgi:hypothetical protein
MGNKTYNTNSNGEFKYEPPKNIQFYYNEVLNTDGVRNINGDEFLTLDLTRDNTRPNTYTTGNVKSLN